MTRFTIRMYSEFGMAPQNETQILFESNNLEEVKEFLRKYFEKEYYFNAVYFIDNELNKAGYVGRDLTINCGDDLDSFCEKR